MSELTIPVKIASDVVCPWCIIGYKKLENALQQFKEQNSELDINVDIEWLPFELNPHMPKGGENLRSHLAAKYGTTLEGSIAARKRLTDMGAELGFTFNYFDEMRMYNTRKAHMLIHRAADFGKQHQLKLAMFKAYFSDRQTMDDDETLIKVAESVGIQADLAKSALNDKDLNDAVVDKQNYWRQQGNNAVPGFIFADKYLVFGAQEPDTFLHLLNRLIYGQIPFIWFHILWEGQILFN